METDFDVLSFDLSCCRNTTFPTPTQRRLHRSGRFVCWLLPVRQESLSGSTRGLVAERHCGSHAENTRNGFLPTAHNGCRLPRCSRSCACRKMAFLSETTLVQSPSGIIDGLHCLLLDQQLRSLVGWVVYLHSRRIPFVLHQCDSIFWLHSRRRPPFHGSTLWEF